MPPDVCEHNAVVDPAVVPTCTKTGLTEGSHCQLCKTVLVEQKTVDRVPHTEGEWTVKTKPTYVDVGLECTSCTECGEILNTRELPAVFKFKLNADRNGYILEETGDCNDEIVEIPATYKGLPVTEIGISAFSNKYLLKKVIIPNGVQIIDFEAFAVCYALTEIEIPDSVTTIKENAFVYCTSLKKVVLGSGIETIKEYAFACCNSLSEISMPDTVKNIGNCAFYECNFKSFVIPKNIEYIGSKLFEVNKSQVDCFFDGNEIQWKAIKKANLWYDSHTSEGYIVHGTSIWDDSVVILLRPEYVYELNKDKNGYNMLTFNNRFHSRRLILPTSYNGLPVTNMVLDSGFSIFYKKIYYEGTEALWNENGLGEGTKELLRYAEILFYSESRPEKSGKYWHYVEGIPEIWE